MESSYKSMSDITRDFFTKLEQKYNAKSRPMGISSGFKEFDNYTNGFQPSNLIVIGSRPGLGKTSFALSLVVNMTINRKIPVAWFSLDMSDTDVMGRLVSALGHIKRNKIQSGKFGSDEFPKLWNAADLLHQAPLFITAQPHIPLSQLVNRARELRDIHKIEIIFIDDFALIDAENKAIRPNEQIGLISAALKGLACELNIPIVVLSQLIRKFEGRRPNLAALRGSDSLENDADLVLFLHRDRSIPAEADHTKPDCRPTEIIVAKNRNGSEGAFTLYFLPEFGKFFSLDR
jgi:replicative DNA helicase